MLKNLETFKGELDQSDIACEEHSKDASVFMVRPQGVFYPKDTEDIVTVVRAVSDEKKSDPDVSLSVRAGGTCMTGGSLCTGYILNLTRHMNHIDIDPVAQTATVEMGAYFRDIESRAEEHGLMFAPYPSSRSLCGIGGMIGNNASGEKSIRYGATSDNVLELEVVLADGSIVHIAPKNISEVNDEKEIELLNLYYSQGDALRNAIGHVPKASSGYRLDRVLSGDTFSALPLFVGAQGTLGIVTKDERKKIAEILKITEHQMSDVLDSLHQKDLIYKDKDVYIFKLTKDELKRDIGLSLLYEAVTKIDLEKLFALFQDHKQRQQIYNNLAEVRHPVVFDFLNNEADKLLTYVKK